MLSVQIEAILFGVHRQAHAETDNQTFFTVLICLFELFLFVCLYYSLGEKQSRFNVCVDVSSSALQAP